jgi:hypothetical protein
MVSEAFLSLEKGGFKLSQTIFVGQTGTIRYSSQIGAGMATGQKFS